MTCGIRLWAIAGAGGPGTVRNRLRHLMELEGRPAAEWFSPHALRRACATQVKLSTLAALCTALECTPNDLFEVDTTPVARPAPPRPAEQPQAAPARGRSMPPL